MYNFLGRNSKGENNGAELIGLHVKRKSSLDNNKLLLDEIRPLHIKHILEDKIKPEKEEYVQLNELDRKKNVSQYSTAFGNMFRKFNRYMQIREAVTSNCIILFFFCIMLYIETILNPLSLGISQLFHTITIGSNWLVQSIGVITSMQA